MALADIRHRPGLLLGLAVVAHVVLISAQVTTATGLSIFQAVVLGAFSEVQRVTRGAIDGVEGGWSRYVALWHLHDENAALKAQVEALQVQLQQQQALAQRAESLRRILDLREQAGLDMVPAEIIAAGASPEFRTVTIDRGLGDGLKADMAVISPSGVVGRLILPSARASKVQLLIDRNAAVGALIERSRAQGVVFGVGDGSLRMAFVPGSSGVQAGDLVVTSGIDGIYPKGFVIGTVETVTRGPGTYHEITVRASVDFSRLEDVLVVRGPAAAPAPGGARP